jgi:glutaminyl-tRNA synthetase
MAVLRPLRVIIENYPENTEEELDAVNNPEDPGAGIRRIPFGREIYIEQDDFRESPPPRYYRLAPGREVRLRYAYFVRCTGVVKDPKTGEVTELRCHYDPDTRGGTAPDGRKVKATIHWVSARHAIAAEVRLYGHLFNRPDPDDAPPGQDWRANIAHNSLEVLSGCRLEPSLTQARPGELYQFERLGYFCCDPDSAPGRPVFNRAVTLRDQWSRIAAGEQPTEPR